MDKCNDEHRLFIDVHAVNVSQYFVLFIPFCVENRSLEIYNNINCTKNIYNNHITFDMIRFYVRDAFTTTTCSSYPITLHALKERVNCGK